MARSAAAGRKAKKRKGQQAAGEGSGKPTTEEAKKAKLEEKETNKNSPTEDEEQVEKKGNSRSRRKEARAKMGSWKQLEAVEGMEWYDDEGAPLNHKNIRPKVCFFSKTLEGRSKVAGFDIDWTLIATKSGKKFPTSASDWKWWDDKVPQKLRDLDKEGYRVIFFSNQAGVEKKKTTIPEIQRRSIEIIKELGISVYVFFSTGENHSRKPSTEMWDFFIQNANGGVKVNKEDSIYVGDAAGRAKDWAPGKPRDFSCTDRKFAANLGIKFATPETFFLGQKEAPFQWGTFDPKGITEQSEKTEGKTYHSKNQELVLIVGMPASGKSSFVKKYFLPHGYTHINRDTLGTPANCFKLAEETLKEKKSVVVDNTNPSKSARAEYLQLAKKNGVPCRCVYMDIPKDLAHHLNMVRQNLTEGKVRRIPEVGYAVFNKNLEEPKKEEGFEEVIKVEFQPDFENQRHRELFFQWTG